MTIAQILKSYRLPTYSSTSAVQNDFDLLLAFSINRPIEFIYTHPDFILSARQIKTFTSLIRRRSKNWPVAYLMRQRVFFKRSFFVSPSVLIPRPATERIIDLIACLSYANKSGVNIADIGTGSGNIVISLACRLKKANFYATDISLAALKVASANAQRYKLARRIHFFRGSLIFPLRHMPIDIIAANLPYLTDKQIRRSPTPEILREPRIALAGGRNGFEIIHKLLTNIAKNGSKPKHVILEIDPKQKKLLKKTASQLLPEFTATFQSDYSGIIRFALLERTKT